MVEIGSGIGGTISFLVFVSIQSDWMMAYSLTQMDTYQRQIRSGPMGALAAELGEAEVGVPLRLSRSLSSTVAWSCPPLSLSVSPCTFMRCASGVSRGYEEGQQRQQAGQQVPGESLPLPLFPSVCSCLSLFLTLPPFCPCSSLPSTLG